MGRNARRCSPTFRPWPSSAIAAISRASISRWLLPPARPGRSSTRSARMSPVSATKPRFRKKQFIDRALEPILDTPEEFARFRSRTASPPAASSPKPGCSRNDRGRAHEPFLPAVRMAGGARPVSRRSSRRSAQDYPARPSRVIATSSAGGTSDIFMRALADELHKAMGQPLHHREAVPAGHSISARAPAPRRRADGYTLCIIPGEPLRVQPVPVQEPGVRSGERLRADHTAVPHHPGAGGERGARR